VATPSANLIGVGVAIALGLGVWLTTVIVNKEATIAL
jgi:hypothetical protein